MRLVLAFISLMTLVSFAKVHENFVLAVVAGETITRRTLELESVLEDPSQYRSGQPFDVQSQRNQRLLQQLLIRAMVVDENRVLKVYQVPKADLNKRFEKFQKDLGLAKYQQFSQEFRMSEADIRARFEGWLVLEKTLSEQEDVETWMKRLRARHTVTLFKANED